MLPQGIDIRCCDCLSPEGLPSIPDGTADAVITDPPYNIDVANWDNIPDFLNWFDGWLDEAWRLLKPTGTLWTFCSQQYAAHIDLKLQKRGKVLNRVVWCYDNGQRQAEKQLCMGYEMAFWVAKGDEWTFDLDATRDGVVWEGKRTKRHANGHVTVTEPHPLGRRPLDVWNVPRLTGDKGNGHPSPKPLRLIGRCVSACTKPGDLVVDPFLGSGTTAEACYRLGRRCIGMEREPKYIAIAKSRLRQQRLVL